MKTFDTDLLIVGGGPAGLALACAVAQLNLRAHVFEQTSHHIWENPNDDGREIALTHEGLNILANLNILPQIDIAAQAPLHAAQVLNGKQPFALSFLPQSAQSKLGTLISNYAIRRAAFIEAKTQEKIHLLAETVITHIGANDQEAFVQTADGTRYNGKLLVAADSRFSKTRQQLGIATDLYDFGRSAMLIRVRHTKNHAATTYEIFGNEATLALLPLTGEHGTISSAVLTLPTNQIASIQAMSDQALGNYMTQLSQSRLGKIEMQGVCHTYPLVATYAHSFHASRAVLVGDAAVGMHPVTAHGYNFGLYGVQTLQQLFASAQQQGLDWFSLSVLSRYTQQHRARTRLIYQGTNQLVKLFTYNQFPANLLRPALLHAASITPPLKNWIVDKLMYSPNPLELNIHS